MGIRVLVISDYRKYHSSRPEAQIFIGLAKHGFHIHVMTGSNSAYNAEFTAAGIELLEGHPRKKFSKPDILRIRNTIIEKKIDILHLFNSRAIINGIQAAKGLPVKVVLYRGYDGHVHWFDPLAYLKYLHPRVDRIHCNSLNVERQLQRQLLFGKQKTVTITKGHDVTWYDDVSPARIRQELQIPENAFLIHTNAKYGRKMKGLRYLLRAMELLPPDLPIHLLIVGRNNDPHRNRKAIQGMQNKDRIHFLDFRTDNLKVLSACNALVSSSIYGESMTKSVIEAMALRIPPVISDIPGNKGLVLPDICGIVFPSRDSNALCEAILRLYYNPGECREFGEKARSRIADHFNHRQTVLNIAALYRELLGTSGVSPEQ